MATVTWRLPDAEWTADTAASHVLAAIENSTGSFRLAVPGGRTPARIFEWLATRSTPAWSRVEILFVDERAVAPDDPESNYRLVREKLCDPLRGRAPKVVRMRGDDDDLERAAREYEKELESPVDLMLLGVGEDGHIASLFPRSALIAERERRVAVVTDSPKPPARRLTITPRVIAEARSIVVVATGPGKRDAVARALAEDGDVRDCPARLVRSATWFVDADASIPPNVEPSGRSA